MGDREPDDPVLAWLSAHPKASAQIAQAFALDKPQDLSGDNPLEITLICMPTAIEGPKSPSVTRSCARCGDEVWASLGSLRRMALEAPGAQPSFLCGPCGMTAIEEYDAEDDVVMAPSESERDVRLNCHRQGQN